MNNKLLKLLKLDKLFLDIETLKDKLSKAIIENKNLQEQVDSLNKAVVSLAKAAEIQQKSIKDLAIAQIAIINANKPATVDVSLPSSKKTKVEKPN